MGPLTVPPAAAQGDRPELADIFRAHGDRLQTLSLQQWRVAGAISGCRTAALGGHVRECDRCGYREISYNSCRNRHCPKCQGLDRVRWQEARSDDVLPVPYFHLVFTVPSELHDIFRHIPRVAYGLLFHAVADTLQSVAKNPKRLGAHIGFTALLHTWTQTLLFHPHVHCIVPGGGLDATGTHWVSARPDFFLHVRILSAVFRGKLLARLGNAIRGEERARLADVHAERLLKKAARKKKWVVYAKRPFAGPASVLTYLGRYTHRIAIGNERLLSMEDGNVTFRYKDRANADRACTMTLPAEAFLRRFLQHVLPHRFVRIRHYGILANAIRRDRIATCRKLLGAPQKSDDRDEPETWEALLLRLTGKDVTACPACENGRLHRVETIAPQTCLAAEVVACGTSP